MRFAAAALFVAFMLSGALYLVFPDQHYSSSNIIPLFRLALFGSLIIIVTAVKGLLTPIRFDAAMIFCLWSVILCMALAAGATPMRVALFWIPSVVIFSPGFLWRFAATAAPFILAVTVAGAFYEYFVLNGFSRFSPTQYRGVSIFINPNNLGITAALICSLAVREREIGYRYAIMVATAAVVVYSGSKTAMVLFGFLALYLLAGGSGLRLALLAIPGIVAVPIAIWLLVVDPISSAIARLDQVETFLGYVDWRLFPFDHDFEAIYVDNMLLQAWLEIGIFGTLLFAGLIVRLALRDGLKSPLWVMFGLASLTTNILYLWPIGYLFWMYVGQRIDQQAPQA